MNLIRSTLVAAFGALLFAMPVQAAEPTRLTEAQMAEVTGGIIRLPRVDSIFRVPRAPSVPRLDRVPAVDQIIDLRGLFGRGSWRF